MSEDDPSSPLTVQHGLFSLHLCRWTREDMRSSPVKSDLDPAFEALNAWRYVLQLYNGIEIALKHLWRLDNPVGDYRSLGHKLDEAFAALVETDCDHIEEHFSQYRSLHHDYRPGGQEIKTASEAVAQISGTEPQVGSIKWRYMPLEGIGGLPQLDVQGMLEIWQGAVCRIMQRHASWKCCGSPGWRIADSLSRMLPRPLKDRLSEGVDWEKEPSSPQEHRERADGMQKWIDDMHDGCKLAAYIDLLTNGRRQAWHEVRAPKALIPMLRTEAEKAFERMADENSDPLLRLLMKAIDDSGGWLRWEGSTTKGRFVYTLPETAAIGEAPADA